ncbi:gluconolaconase [Edaphobacter sp. 12200R-103]|uniref:gluconolaconase n=1 Tax=Edaphobacter sp. 12200R-103 TaxID=2703788 RepID=UPI00138B5868|nr:gluconolaconase [Edaphobacter sp. 12200R-103]QHS51878.1 gluconolaconase [Edaphobacter sp. 12200R-103]
MNLFHSSSADAPQLNRIRPPAAMPGGEVELQGRSLEPVGGRLPHASIGDIFSPVILSRPNRAVVQVPDGSITGDLVFHRNGENSNPLLVRVAVPMAENVHPVSNPVVDSNGQVFTTLSGTRGQAMPVSIFRIQRDFQMVPFVRDLMNPSGMAFGRDGYLYASSRAEGTVYRISPDGAMTTYAEGMGVATGIAFDRDDNLYVGDRSGTIFKINPDREIFVFATLEPSIAAYHLAFNAAGILLVTGPTTSSNQSIQAIDPDGNISIFFQGLGRAQGMAFDMDDNLYVVASYRGQRGVFRITPSKEVSFAISGNNLVGLTFVEDGCAVLATKDALYHVALDIEGRSLID